MLHVFSIRSIAVMIYGVSIEQHTLFPLLYSFSPIANYGLILHILVDFFNCLNIILYVSVDMGCHISRAALTIGSPVFGVRLEELMANRSEQMNLVPSVLVDCTMRICISGAWPSYPCVSISNLYSPSSAV